ncbi:hypothetical protein IW140_002509 [Coemansia sp. RSA 1813]|nr:hypothetical protein EV178_001920 [Coemansia sp. RSA 1646]KAJ1770822.1 hypothetical protein LPJ74_002885 [Coemansia sp. RSA 1843]KAJ2091013.1 hypothetical protein IW138_002207 [Coemansia sp. RSA 986]KAJ2215924.1 hypothetical protein EV179_001752 [Coemansia sp. RSA 487]KAJ2570233.1 hypothetical protein IW140_002509 [Coemansia sp. RSA 1813]
MSDAQTQHASSRSQALSLQHRQQEQQIIGTVQSLKPTSVGGSVSSKSMTAAARESAATEKKDDKTVPVRKRLSLACTTCRQRKVKCDGGRPACRTCAKFNWPCIYQPSNRKRGPRPRALALMDGTMPYSTRSHWSLPHGYYPQYAIPGRLPMSPPPPPPPHMMGSHFGVPHHPDIPQNGAPLRIDPAFQQPGSYNYDSYSSYGDYMANTGAIRIRPPPPPSSSQYMHSPGVAYHPPSSVAARHNGYSSPHNNVHPYARSYQHTTTSGSYESVHGIPLQSHFSPRGANCSPPFARPFANGAADYHEPNIVPQVPPGGHYSANPQMPPSLSPTTHAGYTPGEESWRPSGHPGDAQKFEQELPAGIGQNRVMHEQAPPAVSSAAGQQPSGLGVSPPANCATQHTRMDASTTTPSLGSPTTPQQPMRVSAQPYVSAASPYAAEMHPASAGAETHSLAIYAQKKADMTTHCNNSTKTTMVGSASSTIIAAAAERGDFNAGSHNSDSRMVLSSPPQPTTNTAQNGAAANINMPGCSTALITPMSVPISSTASFAYPAHNPPHYNHLENNKGAAHCSPRESRSFTAQATVASVSPIAMSRPLPFTSNGTSRPQLPPLSEVLGKDYRQMMSPGNSNDNNGGGVQDVADKRPVSSSMSLSATGVDHLLQPIPRRRDSFRD